MRELEREQLPAVRLVRKHIGREENAVCVRDALAWLEGLPEGCCPQNVQWTLLDLTCRWARAMGEPDRQDILGPLLPVIAGTRGWDNLPGEARNRFQGLALGRWLPDWLRLAGLREAARRLETGGPDEAAELALALGAGLGREMGSGEYRAVADVLQASGQGQLELPGFRLDAAVRASSQECISRALHRRQGLLVQDTVRRHAKAAAEAIAAAVLERRRFNRTMSELMAESLMREQYGGCRGDEGG